MTFQQNKTMDKTRKEIMEKDGIGVGNEVKFNSEDFKDKEYIFILAKTYGAAKVFFNTTKLCRFRNVQIHYLSDWKQIELQMNKSNTVILKLTGALQDENNVTLLGVCKGKNLNIIKYQIVSPSMVEG